MKKDDMIKEIVRLIPDRRFVSYRFLNSFSATQLERYLQEFRKAGLQFARAEDVRCVVLRGAGGVFCSGADLKYIRDRGDRGDFGYLHPEGVGPEQGYGESFKQILEYLHSTISEIRRAPKPFIAAVDGAAAAGGLGLAICRAIVEAHGGVIRACDRPVRGAAVQLDLPHPIDRARPVLLGERDTP